MNKRQNDAWKQGKDLESAGYDIQGRRCVRMHKNPTDETLEHKLAKMSAAHVLVSEGYRVDSEVELSSGPVADLLAYGLEDRKPIVVELESNCTTSLKRENAEKYAKGIVRDCMTIDLAELPSDDEERVEHIRRELFGPL